MSEKEITFTLKNINQIGKDYQIRLISKHLGSHKEHRG